MPLPVVNAPTLSLYIDYKKAYDPVWHKRLITKLYRMEMPLKLLRLIINWLSNKKAYVEFDDHKSEKFDINVGLPQGISLSLYIFIIYHSDIVRCINVCFTHIFADDLCMLIVPPIEKSLPKMVNYLEKKRTEIRQNLFEYAQKWKQSINVKNMVVQLFHSLVVQLEIHVFMDR